MGDAIVLASGRWTPTYWVHILFQLPVGLSFQGIYSVSLCLSFLVCEMQIIISRIIQGDGEDSIIHTT